jgi:hemerythrin superfamily protein
MGPFDLLVEQHRELEERITALDTDSGSGEPGLRRERFEEFAAMLGVHARLEERYLYPLLARVEGLARAREEAEDHLAMRELMEELEELSSGEDEWWARFMALEDLLVAHAREEEVELFPRLASALDQEEQHDLSHSFLKLRDGLLPAANGSAGSERLHEVPRWDF